MVIDVLQQIGNDRYIAIFRYDEELALTDAREREARRGREGRIGGKARQTKSELKKVPSWK